jgi:hypothetical protein
MRPLIRCGRKHRCDSPGRGSTPANAGLNACRVRRGWPGSVALMAAETSLSNIMLAGLQGFRACLSRSDFRQPALLGFTEPTQVDPPRMSIIGIDTELIYDVIKREMDVVQIVSPLNVFMTTFEVRQRLQRDPVPGEVRHYVGDEHGPLARTLDNVRHR